MKIGLKKIVSNYLNTEDQSSHQFLRIYNIAKWGLDSQFNLDITGSYKTEILEVLPNKTVELPCGYIQYSKIGLLNDRGEIVTYKRNNQLSTIVTDTVNRVKGVPIAQGSGNLIYPYDPSYYHNFFYEGASFRLFGADSGTVNRGEYKVDEDQGLIFLDLHNTSQNIVLEYLYNGYDESCCDFQIDIRAGEAMMSYIKWKDASGMRKKYSRNEVKDLRSEFYNDRRLACMRLNPMVMNEMQDAHRVGLKLAAKA